jgi:fumarate reductase flavoprotein subunit
MILIRSQSRVILFREGRVFTRSDGSSEKHRRRDCVNAATNERRSSTVSSNEGRVQEPVRQIVIVGGGGTGVAAAAAAVQAGVERLRVIVLEKNSSRGGVSSTATGAIRACDSPLQKKVGMQGVSKQDALKEFLAGDNKNIVKAMIDTFLDNSGSAIQWLMDSGANVVVSDKFIHMVTPENNDEIGGDRQVQVLYEAAISGGAEFIFNTRATHLLMDGDKVAGVTAVNEAGETLQFKADAVVLSDGGFWGAPEGAFENDLTPGLRAVALEVKGSWIMGGAGDAARMGKEAGACLEHMEFLNYTPHRYVSTSGELSENPGSASVWAFGGAISMTQDASRFANEDLNEAKEAYADEIIKVLSARGEKWYWILWDSQGVNNAYRIRQWIETGFVDEGFILVGENIRQLAKQMSVDAATLEETISRYNSHFEKGLEKDADFGRNLQREHAIPLMRAPFYAMRAGIAVNNRKGGIKADHEARALNAMGNPIPNLYAAGATMDTLPFFGDQWLAGIGTTACVVWGRIAGDNAARGVIGAATKWLNGSGNSDASRSSDSPQIRRRDAVHDK